MTARPQLMPDGQDKSDDLIAELAKLMSTATGGEPDSKPAPRLVTTPEPQAPARPAIRIPGMDMPVPVPASAPAPAPVAATPTPVPAASQTPSRPAPAAEAPAPAIDMPRPAAPAVERPAPAPATPARTLRIPGMDAPISVNSAATRPAAPAVVAEPVAAPRPGPATSWQDREVPRPAVPRVEPDAPPAAESQPAAGPAPRVEMPAPLSMPVPRAETRPEVETPPEPDTPQRQQGETSGGPGFGTPRQPPRSQIASRPQPPEPLAVPEPEPALNAPMPGGTGDAIADLIAAELDAADTVRVVPTPAPAAASVASAAQRSADSRPRTTPAMPTRPVPQQPVRAPVSAESDRFAVAPMFGPASRGGTVTTPAPQPAPPPPAPEPSVSAFDRERDPMEEIESLIGEAVRVELTGGNRAAAAAAPARIPASPPAPAPSAPVVPPLNTGFAPRRTSIKDSEPSIPSSEAAILAAAAAVSAEIGNGDTMIADEPASRPRARPERRMGGYRQFIGMGVAAVLLVAAGLGLYWVLNMNRGGDAAAPVLEADAGPVKEDPPAGQAAEPSQGTVVFNNGGNATAPADEQLVSRDDSADTPIADVARTVGTGTDTADSELGTRQVRTVTVRPDGSIVSGDDALARSEAMPVDRPDLAAIAGADVQPSELLAALPDADGAAPAISAETETEPGAASDSLAAIVPVGGGTVDPTIVAPVPMPRPKDRTRLVGGSNWQRTAAVDNGPVDLTGGNAAPAANASTSSGNAAVSDAGGSYAQLSSQRSEAEAQASLRATQRRLSGVLNGNGLEIRRVDLGGRGIWYRVVLPTSSFQDATQACAVIKSNGSDCLAVND